MIGAGRVRRRDRQHRGPGRVQQVDRHARDARLPAVLDAVLIGIEPDEIADGGEGRAQGLAENLIDYAGGDIGTRAERGLRHRQRDGGILHAHGQQHGRRWHRAAGEGLRRQDVAKTIADGFDNDQGCVANPQIDRIRRVDGCDEQSRARGDIIGDRYGLSRAGSVGVCLHRHTAPGHAEIRAGCEADGIAGVGDKARDSAGAVHDIDFVGDDVCEAEVAVGQIGISLGRCGCCHDEPASEMGFGRYPCRCDASHARTCDLSATTRSPEPKVNKLQGGYRPKPSSVKYVVKEYFFGQSIAVRRTLDDFTGNGLFYEINHVMWY